MRKWLVIGAALALMLGAAGGAGAVPFVPAFGLKVGMNISKVDADVEALTDESNRTGFVGGGWVRLPIPLVSLQVEALYSQKGFKDAKVDGRSGVELRYNYLDFPILARFSIPTPVVSPYVFAGGQVGFLLNAEGKNLLSEWPDGEWVDIKDESKSTAFALLVGAGADIGKAHVDLRYIYGLTDINDTNVGGETKERTFAIMVGFQIF
jgi:hypothetical protein